MIKLNLCRRCGGLFKAPYKALVCPKCTTVTRAYKKILAKDVEYVEWDEK